MRKVSLIGGLVLALVTASSTMAAAPTIRSSAATPAAATATVTTWKASYATPPISGSAVLTATPSNTLDKVAVRATGLKKGSKVSFRIIDTVAGASRAIASTSAIVTLNAKGQLVRTWTLSSAQRAAVKAALAHGYALSFRLVDGKMSATGSFAKV
jgi:hypothetical protein